MSKINNGGPAFPSEEPSFTERNDILGYNQGMTLRDYFAAHAPEPPESWNGGDRALSDIIEWRWYYADAMLKARNK